MIETLSTLKSHEGFIRYLKNTSWMFAEQFLRLGAGLLVGIWVARYLGPLQFGIFSYVLAFTALFGGIAKLGLDGIVVRNLVLEPDKRDVYLGTAFWLKVIGGMVTFGVVSLATVFTSNDAPTNLFILLTAFGFIFQSFEVVDFYFQSKTLSRLTSLSKMTQLLISSLLKIYLVLTGAGLYWFILVSLFDQITLALALVVSYRSQKNGSFYRQFDLDVAKRLLKDSWPLILSALMAMIYMRIDQIMIKEMLGPREVGIYSAAVRISEVCYFLPVIVTNSIFPAILSAKKVSEALYNSRLRKLYTLMVWTAIGIAVPMTLFSKSIVHTMYGDAYRESAQVLMINAWAGVFVFLSCAFGKFLIVENHTRINFYRTALGAVLNVILNYKLLKIYGINGAAWSTLISLGIVNLGYDVFDKKMHSQLELKIDALFFPLWRR